MKENGLKIKDLVTIGVFAVIYFGVIFALGMMDMIPILAMVYPAILGVFSGTIIMLFMAKEQKPWTLFILGMLSSLLMFVMGSTYVVPVHALIVMLIAEFVRRSGGYKTFKANMLSFAIFNTWICGSLMQMLLAREKYIALCMMMGEEYANALERLITYPNMVLVYLGAFIGGIFGAIIGRRMLAKHLVKAGII